MKKLLLTGALAAFVSPTYAYITVHVGESMHQQCQLDLSESHALHGKLDTSSYETKSDIYLYLIYLRGPESVLQFNCNGQTVKLNVNQKNGAMWARQPQVEILENPGNLNITSNVDRYSWFLKNPGLFETAHVTLDLG